jgi:predicted GNAT family acetyltransferase
MLLGEEEAIKSFWKHYAGNRLPDRSSPYDLLVCERASMRQRNHFCNLRQAAFDDLDKVVIAHAESGVEENGVNFLRKDMANFVQRCARRIGLGQTWVWIENDRLIFKADVLTYSSQIAYLEAVWTDPQERGKGYATECISELNSILLGRTQAICLLVNRRNKAAHSLYRKTGYAPRASYEVVAP